MIRLLRFALVLFVATAIAPAPAVFAAEGTMKWGVHVSLTPAFFDPADATGTALPLMVWYAVHDALVRPLPGSRMGAALAQSWSQSADGLSYEFVLRRGVKFQNGDPVTAEDVKFSFDRYRGASATLLKAKVAAVEIVDPLRVRFRLKQPWPDFMTFYGTPATGAAWIVPKKYVEKVGDEGFKRAPVGAGPYRLVSFKPGVELVLEAFPGYWRKAPAIKTLVFKVIPDEATRLAALKTGEVDVAYGIAGTLAEEVRRTPGLALKAAKIPVTNWMVFADQADPKSPWHDRRVRLAANLSVNRVAINNAGYLGLGTVSSSFIPHTMEYFWQPPLYPLRSEGGARAARRGRLSQRLRRGRRHRRDLLRLRHRRARGQRPQRRGHPRAPAPARARDLSQAVGRQDAQEHHPCGQRRARQRRDAARAVRGHRRALRLRQLPRGGRPATTRRPTRSTPARAARSSSRCSRSSTSASCSGPCSKYAYLVAVGPRVAVDASMRSPTTRTRRPTRT